MTTATEHAAIVLSGIIPNRRDRLDTALRQLSPTHFPEKMQSTLYALLERYYDLTGAVLSLNALDDLLRSKTDAGQVLAFKETYSLYSDTTVLDPDYLWSIQMLKELAADKATGEILTTSMEILKQGKTTSTGELIKGHEAARAHVMESISEVDRELTKQDAPEGDLRTERNDILQEYADRKKNRLAGKQQGILFGITELDAKVGGMQPGELILSAGYSSDGKTSLCVQAAWSASVEQGKNVVFFTTETIRSTVRRKLVSRHSKLEMFGLPEGLNSRDLKATSLSDAMEAKMVEVVTDLTKNPTYGRLYIAQVPPRAGISALEARLYRLQRKFNIDLVIMDYLALLTKGGNEAFMRQELSGILKETKQFLPNFDGGRGVPLLSPWQVTRTARENAEKLGMYTSSSLSETAEATNSSDIIVSLLAPTDNDSRYAEVKGQILKHRDGETSSSILMDVDYATSYFASKAGMSFDGHSGINNAFAPSTPGGLDSLIN